ncbi:Casein kinase (serine/threonine/tyrosine protein kinase) [Pseudoloma neurophilia]|uniref:Casein kinase (Serine/threonine/tyrosine protein kinase) n=1 Tax=Pseudoloma neurophilia TaxID=146866 RepID=A0A0R0LUW1_9MICR|nr:Casein kinase (serine/threonine/tyrosine protein kinase) [Pseudoloma neurophilia]
MVEIEQIDSFKIVKKLGQGSYGLVFEVLDAHDQPRALKLETTPQKPSSQLRNEYEAYVDFSECKGIANIYAFGVYDNYFYLVMDLLGPSLQDKFEEQGKKFSSKTIYMIGISILRLLETTQKCNRIFRDIKPENILIGRDSPEILYLTDLGMSVYFRDPLTKRHKPFSNNKSLTGTARYASLNTHSGYEQSRRDDLECLGYTLIYFFKAELPWMGLREGNTRAKHKKIGDLKRKTQLEVLCDNIPAKKYLIKYMKYVRKLEFDEKPNYEYLISLFKSALKSINQKNDLAFDWIPREYREEVRRRQKSLWKKIKEKLSNICLK